jgi:hypothetical protein
LQHASVETGRAISTIRSAMAAELTGCVRVHVPIRGESAVYLLEGELIAAVGVQDPVAVLDRLIARGRLTKEQSQRLRERASRGGLGLDDLEQEVDPNLLGRLMAGRFRDNLVFHLFDGGRFQFTPMETVRVPHLQMGHDSAGLLRELEVVHGRISPWMNVQRERVVVCGDPHPRSPQQRHIQAICAAAIRLDQLVEASPFFPAQTLVLVSQMVEAGSLVSTEIPLDSGPAQGAVSHAIQMAKADAERRTAARKADSGDGLSAFAHHERDDRGMGQGEFTGDRDRVVLGSSAAKATEKKPGLRAGAPLLSSGEVVRRIGVCNEVLAALVSAWDDQYGVGEGRRIAQLLLESAPSACVPLFQSAAVDSKGRMGATAILKNVERRPEAQQRALVTKGLANLVDRTLARCAEGLDEQHMERMLVQVAGYRQRLGW